MKYRHRTLGFESTAVAGLAVVAMYACNSGRDVDDADISPGTDTALTDIEPPDVTELPDADGDSAADVLEDVAADDTADHDTATSDAGHEHPTCSGYATRYWDCCKAHCAWEGNAPEGVAPVTSCNAADEPIALSLTGSSCDASTPDAAYTCTSMAPWRVSDTLAYGFAAVPATGDICGRCYEIAFDGTGHYRDDDPGSVALAGKRMIVQATNIGHDVGNGQFDILIPGGGVGLFDACTYQWQTPHTGAQYGGFLTDCQNTLGGAASHENLQACMRDYCTTVFDGGFSNLFEGCMWFVEWYEIADNPNLQYREVACPDAIVAVSGVDRRFLDDVQSCDRGGNDDCNDEQMAECDCSWTDGGASCGADDGSCCWRACCGS